MKIKFLLIATLYSVIIGFTLSNCTSKKEEVVQESQDEAMHASTEEVPTQASAPQFQVDANFQQQLSGVFTSYVLLKDAFVATNSGQVKEATAKVQQALVKADRTLLTGVAQNDWMTYAGALEAALQEIQASDDIEAQRTSFSKLSDTMYKSIKAYGLGGATAYYEFCPMAFNNQGAYWLSDQAVIRNPYFGDKMLKCGSVEERLN